MIHQPMVFEDGPCCGRCSEFAKFPIRSVETVSDTLPVARKRTDKSDAADAPATTRSTTWRKSRAVVEEFSPIPVCEGGDLGPHGVDTDMSRGGHRVPAFGA
ncbi:hypothetical protein ACFCYX_23980 [Streptomyces populi]|uniref:hypothetical protein n=1 Tax=Streptomyces populi TaxID=2058924 RepID=UPI0013A6C1B8|nr:hypothetical protein [Streptomyces populi]